MNEGHAARSQKAKSKQTEALDASSEQVTEAEILFHEGEKYYKDKDYMRAIDWMRRSADLGNTVAMYRLTEIYALETDFQDYQAAYMWAVLYMLHTKVHVHMLSLLPWLSLDEMESAHLDVVSWLEEKKISKESVNNIRKQLANILDIAEQENMTVSEMTPLYIDNNWIYLTPLIMIQ